jgi:hypothetical protein
MTRCRCAVDAAVPASWPFGGVALVPACNARAAAEAGRPAAAAAVDPACWRAAAGDWRRAPGLTDRVYERADTALL